MPGQGTNSNSATTGPTPSTAQLSGQIDQCAQNVAGLIVETERQKNQAQISGDAATADTLNATAIQLSVQYGDLARHQLKTIDDSETMTQTIQGFVKVNLDIKSASTQIQNVTSFANTVTTIVNTLAGLITSALILGGRRRRRRGRLWCRISMLHPFLVMRFDR